MQTQLVAVSEFKHLLNKAFAILTEDETKLINSVLGIVSFKDSDGNPITDGASITTNDTTQHLIGIEINGDVLEFIQANSDTTSESNNATLAFDTKGMADELYSLFKEELENISSTDISDTTSEANIVITADDTGNPAISITVDGDTEDCVLLDKTNAKNTLIEAITQHCNELYIPAPSVVNNVGFGAEMLYATIYDNVAYTAEIVAPFTEFVSSCFEQQLYYDFIEQGYLALSLSSSKEVDRLYWEKYPVFSTYTKNMANKYTLRATIKSFMRAIRHSNALRNQLERAYNIKGFADKVVGVYPSKLTESTGINSNTNVLDTIIINRVNGETPYDTINNIAPDSVNTGGEAKSLHWIVKTQLALLLNDNGKNRVALINYSVLYSDSSIGVARLERVTAMRIVPRKIPSICNTGVETKYLFPTIAGTHSNPLGKYTFVYRCKSKEELSMLCGYNIDATHRFRITMMNTSEKILIQDATNHEHYITTSDTPASNQIRMSGSPFLQRTVAVEYDVHRKTTGSDITEAKHTYSICATTATSSTALPQEDIYDIINVELLNAYKTYSNKSTNGVNYTVDNLNAHHINLFYNGHKLTKEALGNVYLRHVQLDKVHWNTFKQFYDPNGEVIQGLPARIVKAPRTWLAGQDISLRFAYAPPLLQPRYDLDTQFTMSEVFRGTFNHPIEGTEEIGLIAWVGAYLYDIWECRQPIENTKYEYSKIPSIRHFEDTFVGKVMPLECLQQRLADSIKVDYTKIYITIPDGKRLRVPSFNDVITDGNRVNTGYNNQSTTDVYELQPLNETEYLDGYEVY